MSHAAPKATGSVWDQALSSRAWACDSSEGWKSRQVSQKSPSPSTHPTTATLAMDRKPLCVLEPTPDATTMSVIDVTSIVDDSLAISGTLAEPLEPLLEPLPEPIADEAVLIASTAVTEQTEVEGPLRSSCRVPLVTSEGHLVRVKMRGFSSEADYTACPLSRTRRYTVTHDDFSGTLKVTVGPEHHAPSSWYARLMKDVVLAEWVENANGEPELCLQVFVSGSPAGEGPSWEQWLMSFCKGDTSCEMIACTSTHGSLQYIPSQPHEQPTTSGRRSIVQGVLEAGASIRHAIFRQHMVDVLEAIYLCDEELFLAHPRLSDAAVTVQYNAKQHWLNFLEHWGSLRGIASLVATSRRTQPIALRMASIWHQSLGVLLAFMHPRSVQRLALQKSLHRLRKANTQARPAMHSGKRRPKH
eukprot:jgi/Chlat1/8168/Chrsp76S07651